LKRALAAALSLDDLAHACHEAGVRYALMMAALQALLTSCSSEPAAGV
jgi:hypothetical protein